jgi:Protein of unknown function (DUF2845)
MKRLWPCLVLALLAAQVARAEDSLRCGSRIASTGDSKYRVLQICGEPVTVSVEGYMQQARLWYTGARYYYLDPPFAYVPIEVWTYNFGPNKFLRRLRFEGDELVDIRADGYGF